MDRALLHEKIDMVKSELAAAATHLDKVLGEIKVAPRAEKTAITEVVKDAFDKLNAAKANLEELEVLLTREEP